MTCGHKGLIGVILGVIWGHLRSCDGVDSYHRVEAGYILLSLLSCPVVRVQIAGMIHYYINLWTDRWTELRNSRSKTSSSFFIFFSTYRVNDDSQLDMIHDFFSTYLDTLLFIIFHTMLLFLFSTPTSGTVSGSNQSLYKR